jgi:hypothetical protein
MKPRMTTLVKAFWKLPAKASNKFLLCLVQSQKDQPRPLIEEKAPIQNT